MTVVIDSSNSDGSNSDSTDGSNSVLVVLVTSDTSTADEMISGQRFTKNPAYGQHSALVCV